MWGRRRGLPPAVPPGAARSPATADPPTTAADKTKVERWIMHRQEEGTHEGGRQQRHGGKGIHQASTAHAAYLVHEGMEKGIILTSRTATQSARLHWTAAHLGVCPP